MNGLAQWVLKTMQLVCPQQFQAAMGMSAEEMSEACKRGDKAVLGRVQAYGKKLQKENPTLSTQAQQWAQTTFPGMVPGENKTNPTTIERTQ